VEQQKQQKARTGQRAGEREREQEWQREQQRWQQREQQREQQRDHGGSRRPAAEATAGEAMDLDGLYPGDRSGGAIWGSHARASSGGASRRSGVRRGSGICGGGFGGSGGGVGASAATKTGNMGNDDERPTATLETARRGAVFEFRSRWDLNTT